jgi:hypothetical protein
MGDLLSFAGKDLVFGLPPERSSVRYRTVQHTYGVLEQWSIGKTKTKHRSSVVLDSGHRDSLMHRVNKQLNITPVLHYFNTTLLHYSLKLKQAEQNISDLAQRTRIFDLG